MPPIGQPKAVKMFKLPFTCAVCFMWLVSAGAGTGACEETRGIVMLQTATMVDRKTLQSLTLSDGEAEDEEEESEPKEGGEVHQEAREAKDPPFMRKDDAGAVEDGEDERRAEGGPGAGAPWTMMEARIVADKIKKLDGKAIAAMYPAIRGTTSDRIDPPKLVRFGFHSCLKNEDGTGGCDGCMSFENMFSDLRLNKSMHFPRFTDNNNLGNIAYALELIFTDASYPPGSYKLEQSLFESGKSRADLWAFASMWGIHQAIVLQQRHCGPEGNNTGLWGVIETMGYGDACKLNLSSAMKFYTGRRDCKPSESLEMPFMSAKPEVHPVVYGNGADTVNFFETQFGMTPRETVAVMGVHSLGSFHPQISGFKYKWTRKQEQSFNNQYYKNLVSTNYSVTYNLKCNGEVLGGGWQHCPTNQWKVRPMEKTKELGPFLWFHSKDQTAISPDTGLYFSFDVDEHGRPLGCPGMPQKWSVAGGLQNSLNRRGNLGVNIRYNMQPKCPLNTAPVDATKKMHELVEDYARSQQTWINDFIPAYEKMLFNGNQQLVRGPDLFDFTWRGNPFK